MTNHTMEAVTCPACTTINTSSRCTCGAYVIHLGDLDTVLTTNAERSAKHWGVRARIVKTWRDGDRVLCKAARVPPMEKATIFVSWNPPDKRRRDSANCYPTAKAIVDGIVDAGVIPDDDALHCYGPYMSIGPITTPRATVTVAIRPGNKP